MGSRKQGSRDDAAETSYTMARACFERACTELQKARSSLEGARAALNAAAHIVGADEVEVEVGEVEQLLSETSVLADSVHARIDWCACAHPRRAHAGIEGIRFANCTQCL